MLNLITLLKHYYKFFSEKKSTININLLFNLLYLIKKLECVNNKIQDISNLEILDLKDGNHINVYSMRRKLGNITKKINLNYKEDLILNFVKEQIEIFLENIYDKTQKRRVTIEEVGKSHNIFKKHKNYPKSITNYYKEEREKRKKEGPAKVTFTTTYGVINEKQKKAYLKRKINKKIEFLKTQIPELTLKYDEEKANLIERLKSELKKENKDTIKAKIKDLTNNYVNHKEEILLKIASHES